MKLNRKIPLSTLESWLPLLRSPGGQHTLTIAENSLVDETGRNYPISEKILHLLPAEEASGNDSRWNFFYDLWAPFYRLGEKFGTKLLGLTDLEVEQERLASSLPISNGSTLLDVSPGPATYQSYLAKALGPEGRIAALDLSMGMLRQCEKRTRLQSPMPFLIHGNGSSLPFSNASFDFLFHFGGIKLFSDPMKAYHEFARVVKPGGLLFIGDEGLAYDAPIPEKKRKILVRMNPGFLVDIPRPPDTLELLKRESVYSGFAFLLTLRRR